MNEALHCDCHFRSPSADHGSIDAVTLGYDASMKEMPRLFGHKGVSVLAV
jgi:hypothetical protein